MYEGGETDGAIKRYGPVRLPSGKLLPAQTSDSGSRFSSDSGAYPKEYIGKEVHESKEGFKPVSAGVGLGWAYCGLRVRVRMGLGYAGRRYTSATV